MLWPSTRHSLRSTISRSSRRGRQGGGPLDRAAGGGVRHFARGGEGKPSDEALQEEKSREANTEQKAPGQEADQSNRFADLSDVGGPGSGGMQNAQGQRPERQKLGMGIRVRELQHPDFLGPDFDKLDIDPGFPGWVDPDRSFNGPREKKAYMWAQKYRVRSKDEPRLKQKDVITDEDRKKMGIKKQIPMRRIMTRDFNWNPYMTAAEKAGAAGAPVPNAELIPDKWRIGGWGLQPTPRYGTLSFWGTWPDQDLIAEGIRDGRRLEDSYLLDNPLERDHIDLLPEFTRETFEKDEEGNPILDWTNEVDPQSFDKDKEAFHKLKIQLEERAQKETELRRTLPPFKRGFEDVPVKVRERDYHLPEHTGEIRQKWRCKVDLTVYLTHIEPKLSKEEIQAVGLICNNSRYNPDTTELQLTCDDHYLREENEERCLDWFALILDEAKRLAKAESAGVKTWEEYQEMFGKDMEEGPELHEQRKARWREEMLALPEHTRGTYNLYLAGPRMRKVARYADASYEKMTDAGEILQIEGPTRSDSMGLWRDKLPKGAEILERIDELPDNPADYEAFERDRTYDLKDYHRLDSEQRQRMVLNKNSDLEMVNLAKGLPKHPYFPKPDGEGHEISKILDWPQPPADPEKREAWVKEQVEKHQARQLALDESKPVFGLRSCFYAPKAKVRRERDVWAQPTTMPLIGERLTKLGLTPTTSPHMYRLYKTGKVKRVVNQMFWGPYTYVTKERKADKRDEELSKKKKKGKGQEKKEKTEETSLFFKAVSEDLKAGYKNPAAYKEKTA